MPLLDSKQQRAALIIIVLGVGIIMALLPYTTGLIGGIVLYVVFAPLNEWFAARMSRSASAGLVTMVVVLVLVVPSIPLGVAIVGQAQEMGSGILQSPILDRIGQMRIGTYRIGSQIQELGKELVSWVGTSAFGVIGTVTRLVLNLAIALFGLYFLCLRPTQTWEFVRPYIPFSYENTERLRKRFRDVTTSTLIGTGLTAVIQGVLVGGAFLVVGLDNAVFWGVITVVFAILPVLGSGIIWAPAALSLGIGTGHRWGAAAGLALWGVIVVANVDNVIRPIVFRRWAQIHPFVTLIGALGGVRYFGILGLLIGPLALSYFFELISMYREEYLKDSPDAIVSA